MDLLILFLGELGRHHRRLFKAGIPLRVWERVCFTQTAARQGLGGDQITPRPQAHVANTDPAKLDPSGLISRRRKSPPPRKKKKTTSAASARGLAGLLVRLPVVID